MKGTDTFKKVIEQHLKTAGEMNSIFAEKLKNPDKSIDDCITYIMNQVKASGANGFEDTEIFGMAMHYYDEKDLKPGDKINAQVIVNHEVLPTPEEIEELKQQARDKVIAEEMARLKKKKPAPSKEAVAKEDSEQTLFG